MVQEGSGIPPRGPHRFVGDHALIDDIVRDVTRGDSVVVRGPAGVGRSRLLAEVAAVLATRRRWHVVDLVTSPPAEPPRSGRYVGVIDDIHRAGVDDLATWTHEANHPIIATAPADRPWPAAVLEWIERSNAGVFDLDPLSRAACSELAEAACGRPLCSGALSTLFHFSSGLPQHLLDLLDTTPGREFLDRGVDVAGFTSLPLPTTHLRARLTARVESLPVDVRRNAEVLATMGPLPLRHAENLVGLGGLEELEAHSLLATGGAHIEIRPPLLRGHLLDDLGDIRRLRVLSIVDGLEVDHSHLPAHLRLGVLGAATPSPESLADAAQVEVASGDPWTAIALLDAIVPSARTAEIELMRGRTLADIGLLDDAARAFESAAELPDSLVSTPACVGLARLDFARGDSAAAERRLADGSARATDIAEAIEIASARLEFRLFDGRWDDVVTDADALADMAADGPIQDAAQVFAGLGRCITGPIDQAARALPSTGPRLPGIDCWWRFADYTARLMSGDLDGASESAAESGRVARDGAAGRYTGMLLGIESAALSWSGDVSAALGVLDDSLAALDQDDPSGFRSIMLPFGSYLHAFAGDRRRAIETYDRYERGNAATRRAGNAQRAQLWIAALSADEDAAEGVLRDVGSSGVDLAPGWALVALHDAVRLNLHHLTPPGSLDAAATRLGGPLAAAMATHARGILDGDGEAIAEAAASFADMGLHLHAAEAWEHCLRAEPESSVAATARRGRVASLEHCHGARTPALLRGEPAFLTHREQQVAHLAADGLSNRAIAEHLGLSVRTVENHVQRAFGKLGVSRRGELPAALTQAGLVPA